MGERKKDTPGRSVSRILSVRWVSLVIPETAPAGMIIYLGEPLPARSSGLPGAPGKRATSRPQMRTSPLLGLAPGGGYLAAGITTGAGGLLHHLFTITTRALIGTRATCFCGPVRRVTPPRVLPGTVLCGVRTFLSLALSETAIIRPTWSNNNNNKNMAGRQLGVAPTFPVEYKKHLTTCNF